ncbi:MAG: efflux RND transporter periplasmic adaptor subunit [Sulfurifustis sp.]
MKKSKQRVVVHRTNVRSIFAALAIVALTGGCAKQEAPPDVVRPVRTTTVSPESGEILTFAADIRPRYETSLAFRVPGQIVERRVDVGTTVRGGQVIAVLDAKDLELAQSAAAARLTQAESQATLADADFKRYAELRARNFISQAEFDRREAQLKQARDTAAAARADYERTANQVRYSVLVAPHAGVIAAINAEVGQVVVAGQPIAQLARQDEKEVAFSVPEHLLTAVKTAKDVEIRLWSNPTASYHGKLRELSPVADSASRTYPARLSIVGNARDLALGMSAEVRVHADSPTAIRIPLTALFHDQGRPAVWVVEGSPSTVRLVPVTTGDVHDDRVEVSAGLEPGQTIVTAGVHLLNAGQKVRVLEDATIRNAANGR